MICGECGGRKYEGYNGPNSDIERCTCHQPDSIDEFEFPSGPVAGMRLLPRQDRFGSFPLPQHQEPTGSIDEFDVSSGPVGGASPLRAQQKFSSRSHPQHQVKSFQVRRRSYPQHQAPSFQPRSSTSDTMPLALGIGIGVILGAVVCLGFVIVF